MRSKYTFSLVAAMLSLFILTACTLRPYTSTPQLTNIPLLPHNKEVELYFGNEMPKNQVYYEVLGLSVEGTDYNTMLLQLKNRAKQAGVDAVVHINNSQANYTSTDGSQYSTQIVKGIGIKYRDNITYIDQYIKRKQVYAFSDTDITNPALVYEAPFHMLGHEITSDRKPNTTYTRYVRDFSFDYLLYETLDWTYSSNERNQVIERRHYKDKEYFQAHVICYFKYNSADQLEAIRITYPLASKQNVYMELVYASDDQVKEKHIYDNSRKKNLLYVEKLQYDELNRVSQATLYKVQQSQQIPFIQTIYTYYTMDDLPAPKSL